MEALVALALLGMVATVFLGGLGTTAQAELVLTQQANAETLARSQIDYIKAQSYIDYAQPGHGEYALIAPLPTYNIEVSVVPIDPVLGQPLAGQDNGVQRITVTITHQSQPIITLEGYKVNR